MEIGDILLFFWKLLVVHLKIHQWTLVMMVVDAIWTQ
jgi:hypothetical protein